MNTQEHQEAIDLLIQNIGALPHPEYGVINLLPWAVDSEQTGALTREVCTAIVRVFADAGYPMARQNVAPVEPSREVALHCRLCSSMLMTFRTDASGIANVPAVAVISALAKLDPGCPHKPLTLEDHRRRIEEAVKATQ